MLCSSRASLRRGACLLNDVVMRVQLLMPIVFLGLALIPNHDLRARIQDWQDRIGVRSAAGF
jgi:hypothetical protein